MIRASYEDLLETIAELSRSRESLVRAIHELENENHRLKRELWDYMDAVKFGCSVEEIRRRVDRFWEILGRLSKGSA